MTRFQVQIATLNLNPHFLLHFSQHSHLTNCNILSLGYSLSSTLKLECPSAPFTDNTLISERRLSFVVARCTLYIILKHQYIPCSFTDITSITTKYSVFSFSGTKFAFCFHIEIRWKLRIRNDILEPGASAHITNIECRSASSSTSTTTHCIGHHDGSNPFTAL